LEFLTTDLRIARIKNLEEWRILAKWGFGFKNLVAWLLGGSNSSFRGISPPRRQGRQGKRDFPFSSKLGALGALGGEKNDSSLIMP
jgi:hypothetical protein